MVKINCTYFYFGFVIIILRNTFLKNEDWLVWSRDRRNHSSIGPKARVVQ